MAKQSPVVIALLPRRLTTTKRKPFPAVSVASKLALECQGYGARAEFWGFAGPEPRMYDIAGIVAAMGEQLALAVLADHEMDCWQGLGHARSQAHTIEREMAMRALVELEGHYVMALGHMIGNLACRMVALDPNARASLASKPIKSQFSAGSGTRADWVFLSQAAAGLPAAVAGKDKDLRPFADTVAQLHADPKWTALDDLRGEDFHRWRPQTTGILGAMQGSFGGRPTGDGGVVYEFTGGTLLDPSTGARTAKDAWQVTRDAFDLLPPAIQSILAAMPGPIERLTSLRFNP